MKNKYYVVVLVLFLLFILGALIYFNYSNILDFGSFDGPKKIGTDGDKNVYDGGGGGR